MILPKLRTIDGVVSYFKQIDPDTCLNPYYVRQLVLKGEIPVVKAGKKYLIDVDALADYLAGGNQHQGS